MTRSLDGNLAELLREPVRLPSSDRDYLVVSKSAAAAQWAADQLSAAFQQLLGRPLAGIPRVQTGPKVSGDCINLILLDEALNLNNHSAWLDGLRNSESARMLFKLSKVASLSNPYAARNLAFDLFHLAGGKAWEPVVAPIPFCALDAGHDTQRRISRWVRVESDAKLEISSVIAAHTERAEHIPAHILNSLWPGQGNAILCRDGRLSQEKATLERRAAREGRAVIEVKKSPKAVLWRIQQGEPQPASIGDVVEDSHGDLMLQTIRAKPNDYAHPLRLTTQMGDPLDLARRLLHQHAMPGLSLGFSRLSGALYFADLVSKTTGDGWTRAIGRGFNVPQVVPRISGST